MFQDVVTEKFGTMRGLSADDVLAALGLERRRSFAGSMTPIASGFVAGALAGAAIALLFAPKSGREMRQELKGRADDMTRRVGAVADDMTRRVGAAADDVMNEVKNALPRAEKDEATPPRPHYTPENGERKPIEPTHAQRFSPPPK